MREQRKIESSSTPKKKKADQDGELWQEHNDYVESLEQELQNTDDTLDDILANFTSAEEKTQVIGEIQPRPELRNVSSEEFIKQFHQEPGE